jgi:hypothetical protein
MIFKIATTSIMDIMSDVAQTPDTDIVLPNKTADWSFERKPGMLYAVVRAVSVGTNGNGDHFSYPELKRAYKSFIGKGVFVNHQSSDIEKKRGMIVDAKLVEDRGPDNAYVTAVLEINAAAFPELATMIRSGHASSVSMGCQVAFSNCSICNHAAKTVKDYCMHVKMNKGGVYDGRPVYEINNGVEFIEISMVTTGADANAKILEVFARQNGLNLQELMQKAASTEDPAFISKMENSLHDGLEKTDSGDVHDIETPAEKIADSPEHMITIKIQGLIEDAATLRAAGVDNSMVLAELDAWNRYYKQAQIVSLKQELGQLLAVAEAQMINNIDCTAELEEAERIVEAIKKSKPKAGPTPYKMPKVNEYLDAINTGTGGHQTSKKDQKQVRKQKQDFKKNPFKDYD